MFGKELNLTAITLAILGIVILFLILPSIISFALIALCFSLSFVFIIKRKKGGIVNDVTET
jgi:uncharacterized membrane protein YccC